MATDNCWTLWQRLPPRYQLTIQEMVAEEAEMREVTGSGLGSPNTLSSRSRCNSPRYPSANTAFLGTTFGGIPPHTSDERLRSLLDRKKLAFPSRNSRYISNMKNQQRVTSAKQKITSDPSIVTYVPSIRSKTLPPFPVTKLSNLQKSTIETREYTTDHRNNFYPAKPMEHGTHRVVAVHNIFPFDDSKSLAKKSTRDQGKRYLVNDMHDATMFIDNGKIIYFKKTKPRMTQSMVEAIGPYSAKRNDGSYIAHLRKAYLKNPRDMAKTKPESEVDIKRVQQERCDYDKRVGHILEYYSHTEDKNKLSASEADRKTPAQRQRSASPRPRLRSPSPRGARLRSLLSTPVSQTPPATRSSVQRPLDTFEEWSLYFKLNQQSVLHEKQFYLRTPGIRVLIPGVQNITPGDVASCRCRLCRVEMELSVLAEMNQMGLGIPRKTTSHPLIKPEASDIECPGRPNSATVLNDTKDVDSEKVDENVSIDEPQVKPISEPLTIKLPEITEEKEPSEVTSQNHTDRTAEQRADTNRDALPKENEWNEGGLAGDNKTVTEDRQTQIKETQTGETVEDQSIANHPEDVRSSIEENKQEPAEQTLPNTNSLRQSSPV